MVNKQIKPINDQKKKDSIITWSTSKRTSTTWYRKTRNSKRKLNNLFAEGDWDVIDPVGDGFCTIYAAFIDQGNSEIMAAGKRQLINLIIKGMQEYLDKKKFKKAGIKPPKEIMINLLLNY